MASRKITEKAIDVMLGAAGSAIDGVVSALAPAAVEMAREGKAQKREDRKVLIKIPDLIGVNLNEAKNMIDRIGLLYITRPVKPRIKFKDEIAGTIVKQSHKAGIKINPETTLVTLDFITQKVVDKSKLLAMESDIRNEQKKQDLIDRVAIIQGHANKVLPKKKNG